MELIYVTERRHITGNVYDYLARLLSGHPDGLLIREKDLSEEALVKFAAPLVSLANDHGVPLILRGAPALAKALGISRIQLSYNEATSAPLPAGFDAIGVSVHSLEEALVAERRGASTVTYGHIFPSTCKPGLPPRGTEALETIVRALHIPVYAIGGINASTLSFLLPIEPHGACIMSASMTDPHPETLTTRLRSILERI